MLEFSVSRATAWSGSAFATQPEVLPLDDGLCCGRSRGKVARDFAARAWAGGIAH
jgi:hypothetical protein